MEPVGRAHSRRWGEATSRVVRVLATSPLPPTQWDLARVLGVSQARVSQILTMLSRAGALRDGDVDLGMLADLYLRHHRPALRSIQLWYGLDDQYRQVHQTLEEAARREVALAVSADLAPDLLAAWRVPSCTVVYVASALDLELAGFVPAAAPGEATLIVREVKDASLAVPWRTVRETPLVHPLQAVWDLHDLGGADRREAADRLLLAMAASRA